MDLFIELFSKNKKKMRMGKLSKINTIFSLWLSRGFCQIAKKYKKNKQNIFKILQNNN